VLRQIPSVDHRRHLSSTQAATGQQGAVSVDDQARFPTDEPQRPLEATSSERGAIGRVEQQGLHGVAEGRLLASAPPATQPLWRREHDGEQGNERERPQCESQLRTSGLGGLAWTDGDEQDHDDARIASAESTQPRPLHRRARAGDEPEAHNRLGHAEGPDDDHGGRARKLQSGWSLAGRRASRDHQEASAGNESASDERPGCPGERDERSPEKEERVARELEGDHTHRSEGPRRDRCQRLHAPEDRDGSHRPQRQRGVAAAAGGLAMPGTRRRPPEICEADRGRIAEHLDDSGHAHERCTNRRKPTRRVALSGRNQLPSE
jgi:hypothetical protein